MEDKIIDIVIEVCDDESLRDDINIDLIDSGLLDSLSFITLISRLEDEFDIEIQPTQVPSDTWRNISEIIKLVKCLTNNK